MHMDVMDVTDCNSPWKYNDVISQFVYILNDGRFSHLILNS